MRRLAAVSITVLVLGLAACGGEDTASPPAATNGAETAEQPDAGGQDLFATNCAGCHTLAAAGAQGRVGTNLDERRPDRERVLEAIRQGPGAMPANLLEGAEAEAVADYVAENAGG